MRQITQMANNELISHTDVFLSLLVDLYHNQYKLDFVPNSLIKMLKLIKYASEQDSL